ncbi:MAG: J domain-containing protein [Desulfovibrio sp.]|jgi:molecular chaperone DnaJ|nr:J domain-containing protein [Desulfovibrio sp.]
MRRHKRQISLRECLEILRLDKQADQESLKRAYRRRAFELHPDLNPGDPEAAKRFQLLNEAYVALSAVLPPPKKTASRKDSPRGEKAGKAEAKAADDRDGADAAAGDAARDEAPREEDGAGKGPRDQETVDGYAEQDVLRRLLNDPFARRVFEDIYSEVGRKQAADGTAGGGEAPGAEQAPEEGPSERPSPDTGDAPRQPAGKVRKDARLHQTNLAWGTPKLNQDMKRGMSGMVRGWLRKQIDDEQTITVPDAFLAPGKQVRLQIRQGLSGALRTVVVTLPSDFAPGKPVRLRGLGKRIGPWQGDMYLTINVESGNGD